MTDSPLSDWLRDRGPWQEEGSPSGEHAGAPAAAEPHGAPAQAPRSPAVDWEPPPERPGRWRLLLALALLPWLVTSVLAVLLVGGEGRDAPRPETADTEAASADRQPADADGQQPAPADAVAPDVPDGGGPEPPETADPPDSAEGGAEPGTPGRGAAAPPPPDGSAAPADALQAAAVLAVRTDLSGPVPGTDTGGDPAVRYVDLVVPEDVTWVGQYAVVRVAAVVLEGTDAAWSSLRAVRYAVPVRGQEAGAVAVGSPWEVPAPPGPSEPSWTPVADPALVEAAGEAAARAGYHEVTVGEVSRSDDAPGVLQAHLSATAPGAERPEEHVLWLRDGPVPSLLGTAEAGSP